MNLIRKLKLDQEKRNWEGKLVIIIYGILIAGASCISYQYVMGSQGRIPFFYDIIFDQTNGLIDICIVLPFAWSIVTGNSKSYFYKRDFKLYSLVKGIFVINMMCMLIFFIINVIIYLLFSGFKNPFINYWILNNSIYRMGFLPLTACFVSLLFLYIRMTFFTILTLAINYIVNSEICGFLGVEIICIIDWGLYEWLQIYEPLGILPAEHSRIVYTGGYAPISGAESRISFSATILYWVILYALGLFLLIRFREKRAGVMQNE